MKNILLTFAFAILASMGLSAQNSHDTCADADADANYITGEGTFNVASVNGSEVPDPICADNGSGATAGEWYKFIPSVDDTVTISSDSNDIPGNAGKDTRVHIYSGSCGALNCLAGDDDAGAGFTSVVTFGVTAGTTYYIAWDNRWDSSSFEWELSLGGSAPPPPPTPYI